MLPERNYTLRKPSKVRFCKQLCLYPIGRSHRSKIDFKRGKGEISSWYSVPGHENVRIEFLKNDIGVQKRVITAFDTHMLMILTGLAQRYGSVIWSNSADEMTRTILGYFTRAGRQQNSVWNSIAMWQCVRIWVGDYVIEKPVEYCAIHLTGLRNGQKAFEIKLDDKWLEQCKHGVKIYLPITRRVWAQNVILRTLSRGSESSLNVRHFYNSIGLLERRHQDEARIYNNIWATVKEWYTLHGGEFSHKMTYEPPKVSLRRLGRGRRMKPTLNTIVVRP